MVLLRFGLTPDSAVRIHDLLSCLAKFNDAVSLEAHIDHVSLSALNSSKSGYASFVLGPRFFTFFKFQPDDQNESGKFTCSIVNKVAAFRPFVLQWLIWNFVGSDVDLQGSHQ